MQLFFQLPYNALGWKAEVELIRRFETVGRRLGHAVSSSSSARDAVALGADVIFALHFSSAKVLPIYTAGLVWNPLKYLRQTGPNSFLKTLSLDGHLYGGSSLRKHFAAYAPRGYRVDDLGDLFPSAPRTEYVPVENFTVPTYVGSLWQEDLHESLFTLLDRQEAIHGFGPGRSWASYKQIYRGSFPLDAESYRTVYRRSGIGLCLHSRDHLEDNIPAMRIFEIVASGCVAICDRLPFVEEAFGDAVFYLDRTTSASERAAQLEEIVARIHAAPAQAREMARAAHAIFDRKFTLDDLLERALVQIAQRRESAIRKSSAVAAPTRSIRVFTRTRGLRPALLRRALASLAAQTHAAPRSTLIYHGDSPKEFVLHELPALRRDFPTLDLEVIQVPPSDPLSATVPAALRRGGADFFAFLDDDDWVFPEHFVALVEALDARPEAAVAISGATVHFEYLLNASTVAPVSSFSDDVAELLSFEPIDFQRLQQGETVLSSNMLLFRGGLEVDGSTWPRLDVGEDRALLALAGAKGHSAAFSPQVSAVWSSRQVQGDNQVDRLAEPGFRFPVGVLAYKPPVPLRLRTAAAPCLLSCGETEDRCSRLNELLRAHRWLPRWLRPYIYQQEFNALLLAVMEAWSESRFLAIPGSVDLRRLRQINAGRGVRSFLPHRREFHQAVRQVMSAQPLALRPARDRHGYNVETVRVLERLSKNA